MTVSRLVAPTFFALAAAALAGVTTPPAFLAGDPGLGPTAANQSAPALSIGGNQILAVWQDSRTSPIFTGEQSGQDIVAIRLDSDGNPIDGVPIPIDMRGGDQRSPKVAWNGSNWLVAWVGRVSTPSFYTDAIFAARVAPDGTVLDPNPLVVRADIGSGTFGDVASDGNGWAVFYTGWSGATSWVYGSRISASGALLDANPKGVNNPGQSPNTPFGVAAEWAGNRYLVTWSQWASNNLDNIRGQLVDSALTPQGAAFNVASSADYEIGPDVASNGSQFLVVWDRYNNCCVGGASKVYGNRVTTTGSVLDGAVGVAIYDTNGYGFQGSDPAVGWDGTQWVASWTEPDTGGLRINAGRISAAGVVLDFNGFEVEPLPVRQEASTVAMRPGGGSLVVWQDSRVIVGQPNDIHAARIGTNGSSTPLGAIANSAPSQVRPDSARGVDGGAWLAWTSMNSGLTRILVQGVSRLGVSSNAPTELATGATLGSARVAFNGSTGLVIWSGTGGIHARRIDAAGQPLDAASFFVMPGLTGDVAAQGDTFLVTALVPETNPQYVLVRGRRVSATSGTVLDSSSVAIGASYATDHAVEAFDGGFLVVWEMHPTHDNPWASVGVRAVSKLNVPGTQVILGSTSAYNTQPELAVGDSTALVVWKRGPGSSLTEDILARRIGPGVTLLGANIDVSTASLAQQSPQVGFDGDQFIVAWQDTRANAATYLFDKRTDIYASRVTLAGAVLDPAGMPLATDFMPEASPTVVGLGIGSALVAWSDFEPQAPFGSYRIAYSLVGGPSAWIDLGHALAGVNGLPKLSATGTLAPNTAAALSLTKAASNAPTALVIGTSQLNAPFLGGVLVPSPNVVVTGLSTDALGSLSLVGTWPAGIPSGSEFYFQMWITDAAGVFGVSSSNAVEAVAP
jgi:hypothetical protein